MLNRLSPTVRGFLAGGLVMAALWVVFTAIGDDPATTIATQTTNAQETQSAGSEAPALIPSETTRSASDASVAQDAPIEQFSNLDIVFASDLPIEAIDTLDLIASGGPYPFNQDDGVFQNREGILPDQQRGYYREYTVITPSSGDRGARRIVAGADGDLYYTSDHYGSFKEIVW